MARPRAVDQGSLFIEKDERLWAAMEKARDVLEPADFAVLEEAVKANARVSRQETFQLCAAWRSEFARACSGPSPRLTVNEANVLKDIAKREGGARRTVTLFRAFFAWRKELERVGTMTPQPTPFGLQKHVASVTEFASKRVAATKRDDTARRIEEEQRKALEDGPTPEQVRGLVASLTRGAAL